MKDKLRLSFTFMLLWSQGRVDDAVSMYLHKPMPRTKAMTDGLSLHKMWEDTILKKKALRIGATTLNFNTPVCETKIIVPYNDRWDLSGTYDCLDKDVLYEFKSGVMSSLEYASGYQIPLYFLIGELAEKEISQGIYVHYNQYNLKADLTMVWNNRRQIEKARNFIDTLAPDIEKFFIDNQIPFTKPIALDKSREV